MSNCNVLLLIGSTQNFYHIVVLEEDGTIIEGATISAQVSLTDGTPVGAAIAGSYLSNGKYKVTVPNTLSLTEGTEYHYTATITSGTNVKTVRLTGTAQYSRD